MVDFLQYMYALQIQLHVVTNICMQKSRAIFQPIAFQRAIDPITHKIVGSFGVDTSGNAKVTLAFQHCKRICKVSFVMLQTRLKTLEVVLLMRWPSPS